MAKLILEIFFEQIQARRQAWWVFYVFGKGYYYITAITTINCETNTINFLFFYTCVEL